MNSSSNKNKRTRMRRQNRHKNTIQKQIDERLYIESRLDPDTIEGQIKLPLDTIKEEKLKITLYRKIINYIYAT